MLIEQKNRNQTIDILRGIATISVILGHSIQRGMVTGYENNIVFKLIYSFHMHLFMLLSGYTIYLSNSKYDTNFLVKKVKRLIIPTIVWSYLLYILRDFEFTGLQPFVKFPNSIMIYTKNLVGHPDFVIWFLYVVFVCTFVFFIGKKFFNKYLLLYLLIVTVIVNILPSGYLGIGKIRLHLPIFIVGYYIAMYKNVFFNYLKYSLIPCVIFFVVFVNSWSFSSSRPFLWLIAFSGITITYYLVKMVRVKALDNSFSFLGRYSLEIYLFQGLCLNIGIGDGAVRIISIFFMASIISIILSYLARKNKYSQAILFGIF